MIIMLKKKKYKNSSKAANNVLNELHKRYKKLCNNAEVVDYFFDVLSTYSNKTVAQFIRQLAKFLSEYELFFQNFNDKQKLFLFQRLLQDYNNLKLIVGTACLSPIYPYDENSLLHTLRDNLDQTFFKCERKRLIELNDFNNECE